jgi:uncharacterized membrane protein (Fun14 family)
MEDVMHTLDMQDLIALEGGSWLSDFGGGLCCGIAIGEAVATGGVLVLVAIGTCAWALG